MNGHAGPSYLCGLIGSGIQASRTPALHEREGAEQGLRYVFRIIDLEALDLRADALPELLVAAERMGYSGLNITYPCKQSVLALLDELSDEARALDAVNTVVLRGGKRTGHNTDGWGWAEAFRRGLPDVRRERVVQLGAGGAGAAVSHSALALGVGQLTIFDIDADRARHLAGRLCQRFGAGRALAGGDLAQAMQDADGLIHCTPTGMGKLPGMPLPASLLRSEMWVSDVVYFPLETQLLREARSRGCATLDGGGMAVFQAVEAFRLFTGVTPDADRMRRHFASMNG